MIKIVQRLKPFSHTPGASCLIPGTCVELQAFPTLLRIGAIEVPLQGGGPIKGFALQQDLERDCVWVLGKWLRLRVQGRAEGIEIVGKRVLPMETGWCLPKRIERLSLGRHRKQDWDLVWRRLDLREIVPFLYMLGQKVPDGNAVGPVAELLQFPEKLESFCRAGFSQILVPRLIDDQHQGICAKGIGEGDRCGLLREAFLHLRALFFRSEGRAVLLLPNNPFLAGRLLGAHAPGIGEFDLEWAKGKVRRAVVRAEATGEVRLQHRFRVRKREGERGIGVQDVLFVEAGQRYLLDRFQS